jgi:hypothetical protein
LLEQAEESAEVSDPHRRPHAPFQPAEFDTVDQLLTTAPSEKTFFVRGEHDVFTDEGQAYLDRYGNLNRARQSRPGRSRISRLRSLPGCSG